MLVFGFAVGGWPAPLVVHRCIYHHHLADVLERQQADDASACHDRHRGVLSLAHRFDGAFQRSRLVHRCFGLRAQIHEDADENKGSSTFVMGKSIVTG